MLKIKYLYTPSKTKRLSIFFLFVQPVLIAVQPNDYSLQPLVHSYREASPIVSSIWQGQIDPAFDRCATPFPHSYTFYNQLESPFSPWYFSSRYIGNSTPSLIYNHLGDNPSMDILSSHMERQNPFYNLPKFSLVAERSFPIQNKPRSSVPRSSETSLPADTQPLSPPTVNSKEKITAIAKSNRLDNKDLICLYCNKKVRQKSHLEAHIRVHTLEKPFKCTYCRKGFAQQNNLKTHIRIHTNEKPFKCPCCGKRFSQKSNLKTHFRIHTNEKPYACTYCQKKFKHQSSLKKHIRIHTQEKPYVCTYCKKKFAQQSNLKKHLRTHTKEKPFKCSICSKKFSQRSNLKTHIKSQHIV